MPHKDSDQPTLEYFNRHVRTLIANRWEDVGVQLLSEKYQNEINIIKVDHHGDVKKCCSRLFIIWSQRQPQDCTWRALIEAIRNADLTNEADRIEKMLLQLSTGGPVNSSHELETLLSPTSPEDIQIVHTKCTLDKMDEEVLQEYTYFRNQLLKMFSRLEVSKDDILFAFSSLEGHSAISSDMRMATSLRSFMLALSNTQSWYNFGTTATLACMFGDNEGRQLVESYEQKLKVQVLKRITFKSPKVVESDRIEVKFDEKRENFTEQKIIKFRNTLAKLLKLDPEEFVFLSVENGCVQLTYLFPSLATPHIKHNITTDTFDFKKWSVLSVTIRGEVLWQRKVYKQHKRGHDDVATKPKRLKTLPVLSDITNSSSWSIPRPIMRSVPFLPSESTIEQPITCGVAVYRLIFSTRRKRVVTIATVLIIVLILLPLYQHVLS